MPYSIIATRKIRKGQQYIIGGGSGHSLFAKPLTKKQISRLPIQFPSKAREDEMFPVGQVYLAVEDHPKNTEVGIYSEGTV